MLQVQIGANVMHLDVEAATQLRDSLVSALSDLTEHKKPQPNPRQLPDAQDRKADGALHAVADEVSHPVA